MCWLTCMCSRKCVSEWRFLHNRLLNYKLTPNQLQTMYHTQDERITNTEESNHCLQANTQDFTWTVWVNPRNTSCCWVLFTIIIYHTTKLRQYKQYYMAVHMVYNCSCWLLKHWPFNTTHRWSPVLAAWARLYSSVSWSVSWTLIGRSWQACNSSLKSPYAPMFSPTCIKDYKMYTAFMFYCNHKYYLFMKLQRNYTHNINGTC
jgi:hypothetical protein